MGSLCMDVTDGSTANGARLQVWTCASGNANQQFSHSGGDVLDIPTDRISWAAHPGKCMDLTDGSDANGNQVGLLLLCPFVTFQRLIDVVFRCRRFRCGIVVRVTRIRYVLDV